jgi:hypothetical protein
MRKEHPRLLPQLSRNEDERVSSPDSANSRNTSEQVEAALRSLPLRLTPAQVELVRVVLHSSLETDPVCLLLAATAEAVEADSRAALASSQK